MKSFKDSHTEEERKKESSKILQRYPSRVPIIVEKKEGCTLGDIEKNKYLAPGDMSMSQFIFTVRRRIKLEPSEAIFLTVNGSLMSGSSLISDVYESKKDKDGFLYMIYSSENTFG